MQNARTFSAILLPALVILTTPDPPLPAQPSFNATPFFQPGKWDSQKLKEAEDLIKSFFADGANREGVLSKLEALGPMPLEHAAKLAEAAYTGASQGPKLEVSGGKAKIDWNGKSWEVLVSVPKSAAPWNSKLGSGGVPLFIGLHGGSFGQTGQAGIVKQRWSGVTRKGMISACPNQPTGKSDAWVTSGGLGYVRKIMETVKRTYQVDTNRVYLAGESWGGFGSWTMGCTAPDLWAAISPDACIPEAENPMENLRNTPLYMVWGEKDKLIKAERGKASIKRAEERLEKLKTEHGPYDFTIKSLSGVDHFLPMSALTPIIDWMAEKKRDPYPDKIVIKTTSSEKTRMYWIVCPPKVPLVAQRKGNAFEVSTEKSGGPISILLSDKMIDFAKPVTVTFNGRQVFNGMASPSAAVLARTMADTIDPNQFFLAEIKLQ